MAFIVSIVGVGVAAIGLLGVGAPRHLTGLLASRRTLTRLSVTVVLRVALGILFLLAAPSCRLPDLVRAIGILELAGGATLLILGSERLQRFVSWWLERPSWFVRYWCASALAFGVLLAYAGA